MVLAVSIQTPEDLRSIDFQERAGEDLRWLIVHGDEGRKRPLDVEEGKSPKSIGGREQVALKEAALPSPVKGVK